MPPSALQGPHPQTLLAQALCEQQPRGVRVFNEKLEVVAEFCPDREQAYPIFKDGQGRILSIPPEGPMRRAWPVQRVLDHGEPTERNYWVEAKTVSDSRCFRVAARLLRVEGAGSRLIVEEIERIDQALCHDERLRHLDSELSTLIQQVVGLLAEQQDTRMMRLRLTNSNLQACHELRACGQHHCPGFRDKRMRCWEVEHTHCEDGMQFQNQLEKFSFCDRCEVFLMACPDPLTRVGENFNRLLSLLEMKYQEALDAQRQIQQADKLATLGELMLGLAHEVKTPLSVIMGRLDCLALELDTLSTEDFAEDLKVMRSHATRMRRTLEDLLNFARPRPVCTQPVAMADLIMHAASMVTKSMEKSGVTIATQCDETLPPIQADPVQAQQVLLNLLINARDAMPEGGQLTICAARRRETGDGIEIQVIDSGQGIPEAEQEKIFSPFHSTKIGQGGTGLGLSVCRRIMAQHGGWIRVKSRPGEGATFTLWFPARKEDE